MVSEMRTPRLSGFAPDSKHFSDLASGMVLALPESRELNARPENVRIEDAMSLIRDNRDLRIDFFRGLALWWIFTDHIPGNVLGAYSLRNFALCDASEVFVLLAGFGAGLAYGSMMDRNGYASAAVAVLRRVRVLFIVHIFLFLVYAALVGCAADALDRVSYLGESHLDALADAPYRALFEALVLRYQPSLLNILPLYIVLLLFFAAVLPLLRQPRLLLISSAAIYFAARMAEINFPSWTGGGWFFNPLTWQLLFLIGAVLAYAPTRMPTMPRICDAVAVVILLIGLVIIFVIWEHPSVAGLLPEPLASVALSIDKTNLHPLRLTSILSLLWLSARLVPRGAKWLSLPLASPLVLIGQHSLPVFVVGVVIAFAGRLALEGHDSALMQALVNVIGASSLVAVGTGAAWFGRRGRAKPSRTDLGSVKTKFEVAHRSAAV
jgi:hypothetical protein